MNEVDRKISRRNALGYGLRLLRFLLPRVLRIFSPFYNPRKREGPQGAEQFLVDIESRVAWQEKPATTAAIDG